MSKYRPEISQAEFEQIEQYLLGKLSRTEVEAFENRIANDPTLNHEVKLQRRLMTVVELGSLNEHFTRKPSQGNSIRKITLQRIWLYAAAVTVLFVFSYLGWLLVRSTGTEPTQDLYAEYFYPDPGLPVVMSSSENYAFYDGMVSYKEENYSEALEIWDKITSDIANTDTLQYYRGMAYLNQGSLNEATVYLDQVILDNQSSFLDKARWYRALIYLKQNENERAIELLEKLPSESRALSLLLELQQSR